MSDPSLSTRIDLASEYRQQGADRGLPAEDYRTDRDAMAALISDLRRYADWRGIDFDEAVTAGTRKYAERRAPERHPSRAAIDPGICVGHESSAHTNAARQPRPSGPGGRAS